MFILFSFIKATIWKSDVFVQIGLFWTSCPTWIRPSEKIKRRRTGNEEVGFDNNWILGYVRVDLRNVQSTKFNAWATIYSKLITAHTNQMQNGKEVIFLIN
jgi:competence CoiA-like predicted nuclease